MRTVEKSAGRAPNLDVLSAARWQKIDASIDRALAFIAKNQQRDGSFRAPTGGQPGVTALCVMAFLSRGHTPGHGPYGEHIRKAVDYTLKTQKPNGMLSVNNSRTQSGYNHGISGLMLAEAYGMTTGEQSERIGKAIPRALDFTRSFQDDNKRQLHDVGGWRYVGTIGPNDSDLTATSWQLMFYRSAKNAGFDVPAKYIEEAMGYVRRCFDSREQAFVYALIDGEDQEHYASGGTVGGGVVALAVGGEHHTEMAQACGRWILRNPFNSYNRRRQRDDRYHYSAYYCSQAMFQLGGEYWEEFFPPFQETLLENQNADGSWDAESAHDTAIGNIYTTALVVLSLTPPYQLLPIYQR